MQKPYNEYTTVDIPCPVWFFLVNEGECIHGINELPEIRRRSFVILQEFYGNTFVWFENVSLPDRLFSCMHFIINYPLHAYTVYDGTPHIVDFKLSITPFY